MHHAQERPDEARSIRQDDQHPLLGAHSHFGLSRHRCGSDLAMRTVEGLVERGFRDTP